MLAVFNTKPTWHMATTNTLYKALAAAVAIFFAYYVSQGGVGNIANLSKASNEVVVMAVSGTDGLIATLKTEM